MGSGKVLGNQIRVTDGVSGFDELSLLNWCEGQILFPDVAFDKIRHTHTSPGDDWQPERGKLGLKA